MHEQAGHQGAAMTQAIPASLELGETDTVIHPSGSQNPGSNSGGAGGGGTKRERAQLSLLGLQQLVGDTDETDIVTVRAVIPGRGDCEGWEQARPNPRHQEASAQEG